MLHRLHRPSCQNLQSSIKFRSHAIRHGSSRTFHSGHRRDHVCLSKWSRSCLQRSNFNNYVAYGRGGRRTRPINDSGSACASYAKTGMHCAASMAICCSSQARRRHTAYFDTSPHLHMAICASSTEKPCQMRCSKIYHRSYCLHQHHCRCRGT